MSPATSGRASLLLSTLALVVAVAGVGGPVVAKAFDARNADQVDGKHAVAAKTGPAQRKGKLVATHPKTGRLPDDIIKQAPDAARLGGQPPATYLDRYTRTEVDAMPASRLLGYGHVRPDGTLSPDSYAPGWETLVSSPGTYVLRLPGYGVGCRVPFPVAVVSPTFATHRVAHVLTSINCTTGDLNVMVRTYNAAGETAIGDFSFALYSNPPTASPSARKAPQGAEICELTEAGVRCR